MADVPSENAWQQAFGAAALRLEQMRPSIQKVPSVAILRVNQIDAARLDIDMTAMLKEQLTKVFSLAQPGLLFRYEPELNAFLDLLVWRFSIWVDRPTPGNSVMNLRYRDEKSYAALPAARKVRTGLEGAGSSKFLKSAIWWLSSAVSTDGTVCSHFQLSNDGVTASGCDAYMQYLMH